MRKTTPDPRLEKLSDRIRSLRESRGWTMRECAKAARLSASTISRLENGDGLIALDGFLRLCDALKTSPSVVLR